MNFVRQFVASDKRQNNPKIELFIQQTKSEALQKFFGIVGNLVESDYTNAFKILDSVWDPSHAGEDQMKYFNKPAMFCTLEQNISETNITVSEYLIQSYVHMADTMDVDASIESFDLLLAKQKSISKESLDVLLQICLRLNLAKASKKNISHFI